ncbi:patatin-like phospholipase family protein [Sphingomonas sp. WKB10]|nr:patatin-like phospholipase family protein [Sphingomonas sp. WKB10]
MTRQILRAVTIAAMAFVSGCTTVERVPFTGAQSAAAAIAGAPEVRFWADLPDAAQRMRPDVPAGQPVTMLALSGGADEGAYGAGVLNGWTQSGTRPEFSVVTGVSTGALIAPLPFWARKAMHRSPGFTPAYPQGTSSIPASHLRYRDRPVSPPPHRLRN